MRHARTTSPIEPTESSPVASFVAIPMSVPTTMASQLEKLDLDPSDIEYFSVSHSHFDHLGNANLLADATFLVDKDERARMFRQ